MLESESACSISQVTLIQVQVWETLNYFLFQTFPLISNSGSNLKTGHLLPGNILPKFHLQIQTIFLKVPHPSVLRFKFVSCLGSLPQTLMCILYFCIWVPGGCNYSWLRHHICIVPKSCLPRIYGKCPIFLNLMKILSLKRRNTELSRGLGLAGRIAICLRFLRIVLVYTYCLSD